MMPPKKVLVSVIAFALLAVSACGEPEDPNALVMCPEFNPTKKYDKAANAAEHILFDTCIPNDLGQPFYHEMAEPIIVKLGNSRKFLQLKFSVLTKHDFMAQRRVAKHERALRAAFNERMLKISEEDTSAEGFRRELTSELVILGNESIIKAEVDRFPPIIEDVLITSFIVE